MSIVRAPHLLRPLRLLLALSLAILAVPLLPGLGTSAFADGSATTVTGSWHRYDPIAGAVDGSSTPSVTVDQTSNLVDQVVHVSWKGFTPTSNDILYSSVPSPPVTDTSYTALTTLYPVEVFECRGTDPQISPYDNASRPSECYGSPVDSTVDGGHGLNNAALGVTQADGSGSVDLHVETRITNDLLGCDSTHPCSIVVVPNNGGMQSRNNGAVINCDDHSSDFLAPPNYDQFDYYADGAFIGQPCSWADRITVPINFAPLPTQCPSSAPQFNVVGSPMLQRGLSQWQAGWCKNRGSDGSAVVNFNYNSTTDEYQARSSFASGGSGALSASTDVALVTRPADPGSTTRKFTYAPLATNAISIAYAVDNAKTGLPMTDLRLDARLVAKLLTQSYQPFHYNCQSAANPRVADAGCAPEVAGNPQSILDDPEFQQLNFRGDHPDRSYFPDEAAPFNNDVVGGDFASVLAGNSDLTYELTRWIAADPDASSFLAGKPDPWGMHVNSFYLASHGAPTYPISLFQPLDKGWSADSKHADLRFLQGFQGSWNPVSGLDQVANLLVGDLSTAQQVVGACQAADPGACQTNPTLPIKFPRVAPEPIGVRNLWAVVDNASAQAYDFPTAALVNSAGVAVTPTTVSMSAAVSGMKTNPDKVTQFTDYSVANAKAYPLTVVDYAMVPTCGLTTSKASAISTMLRRVVNSQTYGVEPGTIAPGLQALNAKQLAQTQAAENAVSSASCTSPTGTTTHDSPPPSSPPTQAHSNSNPGSNSSQNGSGGGGQPTTGANSPAPAGNAAPVSSAPASSVAPSATSLGFKPAAQTQSLSMVLPLILLLGAGLLIGGPVTWLLTATPGGQNLLRQLRGRR